MVIVSQEELLRIRMSKAGMSAREFCGHNFQDVSGRRLFNCMLIEMLISHNMVENCEFSKMAFTKILNYLRWLKIRS